MTTGIIAIRYGGDEEGSAPSYEWRRSVANEPVWREVARGPRFHIFIRAAPHDIAPIVLPQNRGIICGALFARPNGSAKPRLIRQIDSGTIAGWLDTDGKALTAEYWGGYLAILNDPRRNRTLIIRDPAGARPCYVASLQRAQIAFTRVEDFIRLSGDERRDEEFLRLFLRHPRLVTARTGLPGVREILPGQSCSLDGNCFHMGTVWTPKATRPRFRPDQFEDAAHSVREAVDACAAAWAGTAPTVLHRLSGGLDSSVVLAALVRAQSSASVICMNEYTAGMPEGDEREAARVAAASAGCELVEVKFNARALDYSRLLEAPFSAKPSMTELSFADVSFLAAAPGDGQRLLTSGQGGDQVFHRRTAVEVVSEAASDGLSARHLLQCSIDTARLSKRSVWEVWLDALGGLCRSPQRTVLRALQSAAPDMALGDMESVFAEAVTHPWLSEVSHEGPASALRVLNLIDLQYYHHNSVQTAYFTPVPVLASQPVIEAVLCAPPYLMNWGGVDRALSRKAFADRLPPEVARRSRKGDTTRFFAATLDANMAFTRDALIDGELMRLGLADPDELAQRLHDPTENMFWIVTRLLCEIWLRRLQIAVREARNQRSRD